MSIKPEKTKDGIKLRDTKTGKLAGAVSTNGKDNVPTSQVNPRAKDETTLPASKIDIATAAYIRELQEIESKVLASMKGLDSDFQPSIETKRAQAIASLRQTFALVEEAIDEKIEDNLKALITEENGFYKMVLGLTSILLDYERGFRAAKITSYVRDHYDSDGEPKSDSHLYNAFMLSEDLTAQNVLRIKVKLFNDILRTTSVDSEYIKSLLEQVDPTDLHHAVFVVESDQSGTVYQPGYDFRIW